MKNRNAIRLISFCVAAVLVSLGFIFKANRQTEHYKLELQNTYSSHLDDLATGINNISIVLNKAQFASTPEQASSLSARLLCESEICKGALSKLPQNAELTGLNKFLSQVGNFAMSLSQNLISGNISSEPDLENLTALCITADKISNVVTSSQITFNNAEYWGNMLESALSGLEENPLFSEFEKLEDSLSDLPTLIYDGPFSDHILEKAPTLTQNAEQISEREALEIAAKAAECEADMMQFDGNVEGKLPCFRFSGNGITASVTKAGGHAVYMRKERDISNATLTPEQAVDKAHRYLERQGKLNFTETYYYIDEGVCTVNLAFVDGETICYTDLIKVGVALDNGEIVFYEAGGYIYNHRDRSFPTPVYTALDAQAVLNKNLTVNSIAIALIPTDSPEEKRCYEFACSTADGQEILIYIDVLTLKEEEILILLKGDGGTLVK